MSIRAFQVLGFNSFTSIPSCRFIRFNSFMSTPSCQCIHLNSFMSIHAFQVLRFYSFTSIPSCRFIRFNSFHVNSFISILSWQFIYDNSFVSIHAFPFLHVKSFMSIHSCQFIHFMHFILFQFTSFQLTMNSYKPCLFFKTSAPARAGHYLVIITCRACWMVSVVMGSMTRRSSDAAVAARGRGGNANLPHKTCIATAGNKAQARPIQCWPGGEGARVYEGDSCAFANSPLVISVLGFKAVYHYSCGLVDISPRVPTHQPKSSCVEVQSQVTDVICELTL